MEGTRGELGHQGILIVEECTFEVQLQFQPWRRERERDVEREVEHPFI